MVIHVVVVVVVVDDDDDDDDDIVLFQNKSDMSSPEMFNHKLFKGDGDGWWLNKKGIFN